MATIYYDIDYGSPLFTATLEDNSVSPPVVVQTQNNLSIGQHWFTGVDDGSYIIRIIGSDDCEIVLDADVYCLTTTTTTICNVSLHIIEWECKDVTTTTTTTIDSVENCDVFLVTGVELSGDYKLYTYNPQTKSLTYRFSYATYSRDVAATNTRLWIPDDTMSAIKEYIITLNPWSCTYNRSLVVLGDAINGAGLEIVYADDVANKYIFVGEKAGTNELRHVTFDNSTIGVVTTLFTIDTNVILGDISYDASLDYYTISAKDAFDKRLIICYNATGTPLWTLDVTEEANRIYGLFIYNNTLYGIDELMSSSLVYEITNTLSLYDTLDGIEVQGAAQSFYCGSYLTTTTTTSEPTTTTTTTTLYCEGPLCDTTLTVDEYLEGEEAVYGFDRIFIGFGSLNPDCEDINYLVWVNDETPQLQLQTSQCYNSPIVIEIDGVQYTLISEDEGNSFFLNTSNPFPATGQTCHVRICGTECTTTTSTTVEPTTTTTTTAEVTTTTTTTVEPTTTTTTTVYQPEGCVEYGYLYNWYAATDVRNIAPAGWHVPDEDDFSDLMRHLDSDGTANSNTAGGKIKEIGFTYWLTPNIGATNETNFFGRGAGTRQFLGDFINIKEECFFWQTNERNYGGFMRGSRALLSYDDEVLNTSYGGTYWGLDKNFAISIRLIKDDSTDTGTMTGNDGKVYPTVTIGTQVWMAENLAETKYANNDDIPYVYGDSDWAALTSGARCAYDNDCTYVGCDEVCPTTTTTTTIEPTTTTTTVP